MPVQATTLSSAGTSTAIVCDPVKKATTVQVSATAASSATLFVQYTLDDPTQGPITGATVTWANLSSAIASSAAGDVGQLYSVLTPIGGLRLNSSTFTSGTQTLKALQTVTG